MLTRILKNDKKPKQKTKQKHDVHNASKVSGRWKQNYHKNTVMLEKFSKANYFISKTII